jgi:hypothetical protein
VREGGGEGEGRYGAATTVALVTATEGDSALGLGEIYGSVLAMRGFEVANAALNVFNSISKPVNVCALSNGVLLERK